MAPSLRTVVRRTGLRPLAGALDSAVRWVAVSELADPTPFLEGGELLLTTGMRPEPDFSVYVARLVARGVAGLGFGVGPSHDEVPPALVEAAAASGLPLLEVPRETPFIAISKVVSELLAAEQYDEIVRAFAAQGHLTRAALRPDGTHAVIDRLAREIGGWAVLLDESGEVRHATRGARTEAVSAEIARLRGRAPGEEGGESAGSRRGAELSEGGTPGDTALSGEPGGEGAPGGGGAAGTHGAGTHRSRARGIEAGGGGAGDGGRAGRLGGGRLSAGPVGGRLPASLALAGPGEHIVVQPLGGGPRPRGFFAVGAPRAFTPVTHTVVNTAGSLLTLALEQGGAQMESERLLRDAVLRLLLSGAPGAEEEARAVLGPLGARLPAEPLVVLAAGEEALDAVEAVAFTARSGPGAEVLALVAENAAEEVARLAGGPVGMSAPGTYRELRAGLDQARRAHHGSRGGVVRFAELAGQGLVALLDPGAARAFSAAVLAPLVAYGSRADLITSLRAYLESNGHWDAAAQRLGVHRHTLRYRMRRVAELLGRDLDDPGVRAELWFALEAAGG